MRTIKDKLITMLEDNGLFNSHASEIMELAKPNLQHLVDDYKLDINDLEDSYPTAIYNVLYACIKPIAREYISTHLPQAWFKPMFD